MKLLSNLLILALVFQCILCGCPYGWKNISKNSYFCEAPGDYGRGTGYAWKFGDGFNLNKAKQRCENDNRTLGCEQWGLVIYPKCKEGFRNSACCLCTPVCPSGYQSYYTNLGLTVSYCFKAK